MSTRVARRAREKRERRGAILDAAERVFSEKGAAHATMDEIAEAAEVSKGTLYLYFKSKDDLFLALTHRPLDAVLVRFDELLERGELDGLALLRALIEAHADVMQAHAPQFRLAMSSMCGGFEPDVDPSSFGPYAERVRTLQRTYIEAIERGRADGSMRADLDAKQVAAGLWAGMFGATFLRMNGARFAARFADGDPPLDLEGIVRITSDLLLRALASPGREEPTR